MSERPLIFISAVSAEHRSLRTTVATILHALGYDTTFQDVLPTEHGDISEMLARQVDKCAGALQLVGQRSGLAVPAPRPEFGPCSYTQFEALHARSKGMKVWYILLNPAHPHDPCEPELPELQALQAAYRERIQTDTHLYYPSATLAETELCIHKWRSELEKLRAEWQARMERQEKEIKRLRPMQLIGALSLIVLLAAAFYFGMRDKKHAKDINTVIAGQNTVIAGQKMDAPSLRAKLAEGSERKLQEDIAAAGKATKSDERQRLIETAEAAHQARLARVDDLATRLVELTSASGASPVLVEMTRILKEEGVDPALAYVEKQRERVLAEIRAARDLEHQRTREKLQPLLQAAGLQASKGQTTAARSGYQQMLELEQDWPEALEAFGWFLCDQIIQSKTHGTLSAAVSDAGQCRTLAEKLLAQASDNPKSQRLLSVALQQLGEVLTLRGQPGDAEQALQHYTRSLEAAETLLKTNPDSAEATRDVSVSLNKLGDFLAQRGQPGDAEQALNYYTRSFELCETLLKANPDSAQAARDVSVSLNKLGDFLAHRGQPGDAEQALQHYTRSLELRETLLKANPDSAQAARGASVSLEDLGDFLAQRGQPGDAEQAFQHYTRSLELRETLLKANPDSAQAARDVSVSLDSVGDFLAQRGQPGAAEQALKHYARSLELGESLLKANPDSALAARDVSVSLEKLGDFLAQRGQTGAAEQALQRYTRSLQLRETLLKANPDSAQAARDVSVSLNKFGNFLAQRGLPGDAEQALKQYTRNLEISEALLKANPNSAQAARDVWVACYRLGHLMEKTAQGDARARYQRAYDILAEMMAKGRSLQAGDEQWLDELRKKLGK